LLHSSLLACCHSRLEEKLFNDAIHSPHFLEIFILSNFLN